MSMASRPQHGLRRASRAPQTWTPPPQGPRGLQAPGVHRALTSRWNTAGSFQIHIAATVPQPAPPCTFHAGPSTPGTRPCHPCGSHIYFWLTAQPKSSRILLPASLYPSQLCVLCRLNKRALPVCVCHRHLPPGHW